MQLPIFELSFWVGLPFVILFGVVLRNYFRRLEEKRNALAEAIKSLEAKKRN